MTQLTYKEKFIQMNKEAKGTGIVGLIICAFWWITGFGIYYFFPDARIFYMPAWFIISCFGSWILGIVLVYVLLKTVFADFDLEDNSACVDVSQRNSTLKNQNNF